jgi:cytochrome o ubiquinol oxidase operon protein cyoD
MSHSPTPHTGASHGSVKSYIVGFIFSVLLTVVPFWMVMNPGESSYTTILYVVIGMAMLQILVQLVYFLHMNGSSESSWNTLAFVFTVLIIAILVVGSLWIMFHLNTNMGH